MEAECPLAVDFLVTLKNDILKLNPACVETCLQGLDKLDASHAAFVTVVGQPKSGKTALANLAKIFLEFPKHRYLNPSDWMEWASAYGIPKEDPISGGPISGIDTIGVLIATRPCLKIIEGRRTGVFFIDIWALEPSTVEYATLVDFCLLICSTTVFSELPSSQESLIWSRQSSRITQLLDTKSLKRLHVLLHYLPDEVHNRARFCNVDKAEDLCDELELVQFDNFSFLSRFHVRSSFFFIPIPAPDEAWNFNIKQKTKYFEALKNFFENIFSERSLASYFPLRPAECLEGFLCTKIDALNSLTQLSKLAVQAEHSNEDIKTILGGKLLGTSEDYDTFMMSDRFKFIAAAAQSLYQPLYEKLQNGWKQQTYVEPERLEQEYQNFLNDIQEDSRLKYGEEISKALQYIAPTMFKLQYENFVEENSFKLAMLERYNAIINAKLQEVERSFRDSFQHGTLPKFKEELPGKYGMKFNPDDNSEYLSTDEDSPWQQYIMERYEKHMKCMDWATDTLLKYEELLEDELRHLVLDPSSNLTVGEPKVPETEFCVESVKSLLQECLFELYGVMIHKQSELTRKVQEAVQEHEHAVREQLSKDVKVVPSSSDTEDGPPVLMKNTRPFGGRETQIFKRGTDDEGTQLAQMQGRSSKTAKDSTATTVVVKREGHSIGIHIGASAVRVGLYGSTSKVLKRCFSEPPYIEFPSNIKVSNEDVSKLIEDRHVKAIHIHDCLVNLHDPPYMKLDSEHALSWEEMLALFFTRLKKKAEQEWKASPITTCVVALDAYTPMFGKFRLKIALALAGFAQSFLVQTTTAIMSTYSLDNQINSEKSAAIMIVYQSKETFDIIMCSLYGGKTSVQTTNGLPLIKQQDTLWEKILGFNKIVTLVTRVLSQVMLDVGILKEKLDAIVLVTEQECFETASALEILQHWAGGVEVISKGPKDGILPGLIYFSANPPFTSTPLSENYDQLFPTTIFIANGKKHTLIRRNEQMPIGGIVYDLPIKFWRHSKKLTISEQIGDETHVVAEFNIEGLDLQDQFIRVTVDRDGLLTLEVAYGKNGIVKPLSPKSSYYMPPEKYEEIRRRIGNDSYNGKQTHLTDDKLGPKGQFERHVVIAEIETRVAAP